MLIADLYAKSEFYCLDELLNNKTSFFKQKPVIKMIPVIK
jgi:hypothetical protein